MYRLQHDGPGNGAGHGQQPGCAVCFSRLDDFCRALPRVYAGVTPGSGNLETEGADAYMAYHNGIYGTGHNEGKLTSDDIEKVATAAGAGEEDVANRTAADALIAGNSALAELLGLSGTPGIIVMPAENATADNTTVIPGVVSAQVMQQAIDNAMK